MRFQLVMIAFAAAGIIAARFLPGWVLIILVLCCLASGAWAAYRAVASVDRDDAPTIVS